MSQQRPERTTPDVPGDSAARAVVEHHAQLSAGLAERVASLVHLVDTYELLKAERARLELVRYLRQEIVTHAEAEEQRLYPPAAALPEGRLLVQGMIAEHRALTGLVSDLADEASLVRACGTARAVEALFGVHLAKENELILPLLVGAPDISLAEILEGMHELLGEHAEAQPADGCACGGCGCGGDQATAADATTQAAPLLSVDNRLDVRDVPHDQRHALVLSTVAALPPGQAVVLVASHAPRPVLSEIDARFGDRVRAEWLQSGPQVWQVRLERVAAAHV